MLADVVRPSRRKDAVTPTSRRYDRPEEAATLERWLGDAGFDVHTSWSRHDLIVFSAVKARAAHAAHPPTRRRDVDQSVSS